MVIGEKMKKDILIIIGLFLLAFVIRAIGVSNIPMYGDEWVYWTDTNRILANNFFPREDVFDFASPFIPYIGAVLTLLFEGDLNVYRMISVISGSLTVPLLYLFGSEIYDRRTGLLSALFLLFSAYHALYSRLYMLEATTLLFICAFLYFFWLSESYSHEKKGVTYAIVSGVMLGLAFDSKYISMFLIPAIFAYVLWTRRFNLKAILEKRMVLIPVFTFLTYFPILVGLFASGTGLRPFYYMGVEKYEKAIVGHTRTAALPFYEMIIGGGEKIIEVLSTWGAEIVLIPSWEYLFKFSAVLLFIFIILYYLYYFIKGDKKASFLIIPLFTLFGLLLLIGRMRHYVLYAYPFYYVMLSHVAVVSFDKIKTKNRNDYKNIFRIFTIFFTIILLFSSIVTGVTSYYWDMGDYNPWVEEVVEYVKNDAIKSGNSEHFFIGVVYYLTEIIDYPLYINNINASTIFLFKAPGEYSGEIAELDLDKIDRMKPDYLIVSDDFYDHYFFGGVEREILKDYELVFQTNTYPHTGLVLKRKNLQTPELVKPSGGKEGKISYDLFEKSIPSIAQVGNSYTTVVQVKNTGDNLTNFLVIVHSDKFKIFVNENWHVSPKLPDMNWFVTIDKGSSKTVEIIIVPIKESTEKIPVTCDLYAKSDYGYYEIVDSYTDYVLLIKK